MKTSKTPIIIKPKKIKPPMKTPAQKPMPRPSAPVQPGAPTRGLPMPMKKGF